MGKWLIMLALLLASPVLAQTLQKCVGKGGAVAFRSGDCLPNERLAGLRDGSSDRRSPEEWRALQERQSRERAGSQYLSRLAGTDNGGGVAYGISRRDPKAAQCAHAKRERQRIFDSAKGRASMELHSRLNNWVYDACKP